MTKSNGKRRLILCLAMTCLIIGVGCASVPKVAPPPLPEKPALESLTRDKNDKTGEMGYWLDEVDLRDLTGAWEGVESVRRIWK